MTDKQVLEKLKIYITCARDEALGNIDLCKHVYEETKNSIYRNMINSYQREVYELNQYLEYIDERLREEAPREQKPNN